MIGAKEIEAKAQEFGIHPQSVEKDYVYGWVLAGIYSQSILGTQLILKGGNALRKAFLPNTRFSKDLDFSCVESVDQSLLVRELNDVCRFVQDRAGVQFALDRTLVKDKDLPTGIEAVEARMYFKGFYGEEDLTLKAQLDITQFDKIYLPVQFRPLQHPYSDSSNCNTTLRCQKIEEILASKLTTLLHRRKAIDLFDLLYAVIFRAEFPVERLQVITTFLKKSIFEPQPAAAKDQLLSVSLDDFRPLWSTIVAPVQSLFNFEYAMSTFRSLIETLFGMVIRPAVAPAAASIRGFPSAYRTFSMPRFGYGASSYFGTGIRNTILSGVRSQTLVELVYDDGIRRLIEPYNIEYYIRKSDGIGLEYFWGYDRTGGKSGPGIKRFICDKIASVRQTSMSFVPQF